MSNDEVEKLKKLLEQKNKELELAKSQAKTSSLVVVDKSTSAMHFSIDSGLLELMLNNDKIKSDFIISDEIESDFSNRKITARIIRVKKSFREFCRNVLKKAIKKY